MDERETTRRDSAHDRVALASRDETAREELADALIARLAYITSRRRLWEGLRPIRYGSGITSQSEFNVLVQAIGRAATLRRMITAVNEEKIRAFLTTTP